MPNEKIYKAHYSLLTKVKLVAVTDYKLLQ